MIRTSMVLLALLLAGSASATVVELERAGEVCRFRAGDRENPFRRWLVSQEVTCAPASAPVVFPRGLWNVFARTGDAVSTPVLVDGEAAPEKLSLPFAPAAAVVPLLPPKSGGVIYAPRRASAFPVDAERVLVPADEELWLIALEKAVPVAVVPIAPLAAGTEQRVDARSGGPSAILGWLRIPEEDRAAIAQASGVLTPGVRAISGTATRDSDPLPRLSLLHGAFVRIRDVPAGNAELRVEGRGWIPARRGVKVESSLALAADPLLLRTAATIVVYWSTPHDLAALDRSFGSCEGPENAVPLVEIAVSRCAGEESCSVIREEKFEPVPAFGSVTLDDIPPGVYQAAMRFGKLPPVATGPAPVGPLQVKEIRVSATYIEAYGSVTHGGEPLGEGVRIKFPGGVGFAPQDTDEYHAVLRGLIGPDVQITVAACDDSPRAIVLSDEPMRRSTRFNIDIPDNELTINVTDTFTREALRGATVRYEVISKSFPRRPVIQETLHTGGDGSVTKKSVPEREIELTVQHTGYEKQKVETFTMPRSDVKTIDVQLMPLRGSQGKVHSSRPFDGGAVVWFSPEGVQTERADLAADGTFVYGQWHAPEETMAVVSLSHPLWVLRSPSVGRRETITVRFPEAPVRSFDVVVATADPRPSWHAGIVIGGVRVPQPVLVQHLTRRRLATVARSGRPLHARDLLATGPIDVILGRTVQELNAANAPRQRVAPEAATVLFEVK